MNLLLRRYEVFSPFSPLSTTKSLDITYEITIRRVKDGEDKADGRIQDQKNGAVVSAMGFLFVSFIPDTELKKPATQKRQPVKASKHPQNPALHQKSRKRAAQQNRKLVANNNSTPAKHHRKKTWSHCHAQQQTPRCKPEFPHLPTCNKTLQLPPLLTGWCQRQPPKDPRHSFSLGSNECPPSPGSHWQLCAKTRLLPLPSSWCQRRTFTNAQWCQVVQIFANETTHF